MMKKNLLRTILAMSTIGLPAPSTAQLAAGLDSAATIRITAPSLSDTFIHGNVTGSDDTTISILRKDSESTERIEILAIEHLEVDRGSGKGKSALIGLAVGAGIGLATTLAAGKDGDENDYATEILVPPAAAAGLLVGVIVGPSHTWETVTTKPQRP